MRVHFERSRGRALCGRAVRKVNVATDIRKVTCGSCRRVMHGYWLRAASACVEILR